MRTWRLQLDIRKLDDVVQSLPKNSLLSRFSVVEYQDVPDIKTYDMLFRTRTDVMNFFDKFKVFVIGKDIHGTIRVHSCDHSDNEPEKEDCKNNSDYKSLTF